MDILNIRRLPIHRNSRSGSQGDKNRTKHTSESILLTKGVKTNSNLLEPNFQLKQAN